MRVHRVVGIRPAFDKPDEHSKLLPAVAVTILVAVVAQVLVLMGHGVWFLEVRIAGLFHG